LGGAVCAFTTIKIQREREPPSAATFIAAVATAHAVHLMLLRRLQNIMRASGGGGDGGGVRGRQPLITAHTLPSPILIIIMTELQLACRAAGTLLLMRLCFQWLEL
jgi:hypothetical protein